MSYTWTVWPWLSWWTGGKSLLTSLSYSIRGSLIYWPWPSQYPEHQLVCCIASYLLCNLNIQSCTVTIMCIWRELILVYPNSLFTFLSSAKAHWVTYALGVVIITICYCPSENHLMFLYKFATLVNMFTKGQTGRDGRYIITLLLLKIELGMSHKIRCELGQFPLRTVATIKK